MPLRLHLQASIIFILTFFYFAQGNRRYSQHDKRHLLQFQVFNIWEN